MRDNMGLYHAKRTYNGKWVEGCLVVTPQGDAYIISTAETKRDVNVLINQCSLNVDPETIGQFTGLTDKNGKRIFEGDIVHCVSKLDSADMVVIFECGQFRMVLAEKYHEYQTNVGYYDINCFAKEVIGNIHDNPELLR